MLYSVVWACFSPHRVPLLPTLPQWPESLRRALIRNRYIDEGGAVLRTIPGWNQWRAEQEARRGAPPPTPEEAAAEAAHKAKWAPRPMTEEEEASLRAVYDSLESDPGLEKYYMPFGELSSFLLTRLTCPASVTATECRLNCPLTSFLPPFLRHYHSCRSAGSGERLRLRRVPRAPGGGPGARGSGGGGRGAAGPRRRA